MLKLRKDLWLWGGLVPALVIAVDQASKYWVINKFGVPQNICATNPYSGLQIEVSPVFDLALVCNLGVSFGLFSNHPEISRIVFTIFAAVMCVVLLFWINKEKSKLMTFSLSLIIGGAIGNAIDRARFGAVTDFLNFGDIYFKWVFNVADSMITCGVIGLIIAMFLQSKAEKSP
ncbi:MAG: signal peptidase II [Robiginitomaculum sp.]